MEKRLSEIKSPYYKDIYGTLFPGSNNCSNYIALGELCYDIDDKEVYYGDGNKSILIDNTGDIKEIIQTDINGNQK